MRIEQLRQAIYHAPFATMALAHGRNFGAGADLQLGTRSADMADLVESVTLPGLQARIAAYLQQR